MRRIFFAAVCVLAASAGCRQCASPYDYCSPVVENGPCPGPGPVPGGAVYDDGSDYAANRGRPVPQASGPDAAPQTAQQPAQGVLAPLLR